MRKAGAHRLEADIVYIWLGRKAGDADHILSEVRHRDVSSLVMAAYPWGQLFEMLFGGLTFDLLWKAKVPLFLAH
jgi:hypothetical protein